MPAASTVVYSTDSRGIVWKMAPIGKLMQTVPTTTIAEMDGITWSLTPIHTDHIRAYNAQIEQHSQAWV
jgi:hypothetical protein